MNRSPSVNVTGPSEAENAEQNVVATSSTNREDRYYFSADLNTSPLSVPREWPKCVRDFSPVVNSHAESIRDMVEIEKSFSKQTSVRVLAKSPGRGTGLHEMLLDGQNSARFQRMWKESVFLACFVNRFIMHPSVSDIPKDKKRLRISGETFRWLLVGLDAPPTFVSSMLNPEILAGLGSRATLDEKGSFVFACWYTLPVRTAASCFDEEGSHALSVAGSNQIDPNGYLHLGDITHDLRPSKVGVYCRYDYRSCRMIFMDFQDGRLHELADEPFSRIREWWTHALSQLKRQLLYYETRLLDECMPRVESVGSDMQSDARHLVVKKTLHSINSHLLRFRTELQGSRKIALDLQTAIQKINQTRREQPQGETNQGEPENENLAILIKRFSALEAFVQELDRKSGTVMELLSHVVNQRNEAIIVKNGQLVQKLLKSARAQSKASQSMARESQQMARDMRKDSISMKTIALLTMAFLPGTSFAAVLSMPIFSQQEWFNDPAKIWLWVVLTAPATVASVLLYLFFTNKELKSRNQASQDNEEEEMESIDFALE